MGDDKDVQPQGNVLLAFYGDDFTGSTDSMEALAANGLETVLFLDVPTEEFIQERFPEIRCYGIAGVSRSMGPEEMRRELLPVFEKMKAIPSEMVHYKICSTFDSSPEVGSFGVAISLAKEAFGAQTTVPLLVGAPVLRRYTVFGNHFATVGDTTYRLDRHPTMSKHPITPMHESDLRKHLSLQTDDNIGLFSILDLAGDLNEVKERYVSRIGKIDSDIMLFDIVDDKSLDTAGRLVWENRNRPHQFVVGSSGVEYALTSVWTELGYTKRSTDTIRPLESVGQIAVLSGSASPVTKEQVEYAVDHGFQSLRIPVLDLLDDTKRDSAETELIEEAHKVLRRGESLIMYTALGPEDEYVGEVQRFLSSQGMTNSATGKFIGQTLGRLGRDFVQNTNINRLVFAGGDTCGYAARELGIYGLKMISPIAPGGPLCRTYAENPAFDNLEIVLKGGQVGREDYFLKVLQGDNPAAL